MPELTPEPDYAGGENKKINCKRPNCRYIAYNCRINKLAEFVAQSTANRVYKPRHNNEGKFIDSAVPNRTLVLWERNNNKILNYQNTKVLRAETNT
jgi:hypothetical protein